MLKQLAAGTSPSPQAARRNAKEAVLACLWASIPSAPVAIGPSRAASQRQKV